MKSFTFGAGSHATREDGMCVMETVAFLAGEPHTMRPKCADATIGCLAMFLNDRCDDKLRQELCQDLPWRIVGTASNEFEAQRRCMFSYFRRIVHEKYNPNDNEDFHLNIYNSFIAAKERGRELEFLYELKDVINKMIALTEVKETVPEKNYLGDCCLMGTKTWWALLNKHWDYILPLIEDFHPGNRKEEVASRFPITAKGAKGAEEACATIRRQIGTLDAPRVANNARFNQDTATMLKILNETWFGLPESVEVRSLAGFGVLCDLCDDFPEEDET